MIGYMKRRIQRAKDKTAQEMAGIRKDLASLERSDEERVARTRAKGEKIRQAALEHANRLRQKAYAEQLEAEQTFASRRQSAQTDLEAAKETCVTRQEALHGRIETRRSQDKAYRELYFARIRYIYQDDTRIKSSYKFTEWHSQFDRARQQRTEQWDAMTDQQRQEWVIVKTMQPPA